MKRIERGLEMFMFGSRWLLVPFYVALMAGLVALLAKSAQHTWHFILHAWDDSESEVILNVLGLVDLTLTGSLIVIVIFSGYENFVSRVDQDEHRDWPAWMGQIDFAGLKQKLLASIVAIAAVQMLRTLLNIKNVSDREIMWQIGLLFAFVVAAIALALCDRLTGHDAPHPEAPKDHPAK